MRNPVNLRQRLSQSLATLAQSFSLKGSVFFLLTLGLTVGSAVEANAAPPETAPPQIKDTLTQIDAAANRRDLESVLKFYSPSFKNSDGLTSTALGQALTKLWERYPQLTYRTELQSWENDGNAIVAETITYITGEQSGQGSPMKLASTLRSRQRYEGQTIVSSEILAEDSQVTSGTNPPTVQVILPEKVRIGQQFAFDVIVQQPLGDNLLLGTALEEQITPERYATSPDFELELLPAGGIFKVGRAPLRAEPRWVSAVLIWGEGMTTITRRLQIVDSSSSSRNLSR
ncbi:MAG TPA: hypothetical protein DDZ80_30170 [Cyanobacteria bacterium UBA8803]|nr:hypothetical protein [Cyanobacteria bacterium UBA9273]HBL62500.1 hypothetical protein [Cyanobacteria bacterium UBA8803]